MGLHQRTRDYLYQEFVRRNYQGASDELKKTLLSLRPDDMVAAQKTLARENRRQEALGAWVQAFGHHRRDLEKNTLELLRKEGGLGRLSFYRIGSGSQFERKWVVGGDAGFPKGLTVDPLLKPAVSDACLVASPDWPWSHDLKNQGLSGRHVLFQKNGKPSALLAWSNAVALDAFGLLVVQLLAIFRGDRPLPTDPAPQPPKKAPAKPATKAPQAKKAQKKILEPSKLLRRKLLAKPVLGTSEGAASGDSTQPST